MYTFYNHHLFMESITSDMVTSDSITLTSESNIFMLESDLDSDSDSDSDQKSDSDSIISEQNDLDTTTSNIVSHPSIDSDSIIDKIDFNDIPGIQFMNSLVRYGPIDPIKDNTTRQVKNAFVSLVKPTPISNPKLVLYSKSCCELLNLKGIHKQWFEKYMSGNDILPGSIPHAMCYCGHQFGVFAGQLGDGRAINFGDCLNSNGERWEIQLKGAGKTPYSRNADGRAVLRSSIREFLCSEAMHYLDIPTTRALSIITSDTPVFRDIEYNGNIQRENASIVTRLAPTFIRFGSFQIADPLDETGASGPSINNHQLIRSLIDYVTHYFYPEAKNHESIQMKTLSFADELCWKTAYTVAQWQAIGFTHGVLNTDNMSIIGLTIDYGPFGFMEDYDPNFIPNKTDKQGRYRFSNQPNICKWNLEKLFYSIGRAVPNVESELLKILNKFCERYKTLYLIKLRLKLGIMQTEENIDQDLIDNLLETMAKTKADYTNVFRILSEISLNKPIDDQLIPVLILDQCREGKENKEKNNETRKQWIDWLRHYKSRLIRDGNTIELIKRRKKLMNEINPRFIPRNYLIQDAIDKAEKGDYSEVRNLLQLFSDPYDLRKRGTTKYDQRPGKSTVSVPLTCSS